MDKKYCVSVDWLQVCCYGNQINEGEYRGNCKYHVSLCDIQTAMFERVLDVSVDGLTYATIQQTPRSSALKKNLTLIKINNRVLWSERYIEILYDIIRTFHLIYKGVTRIDLCFDCNYFYNGLHPAKFIKNFVFNDVSKKGGIYRRGSEKFTLQGGKNKSGICKFSGIKFGSAKNSVVPYIYDKTLEMKEVKDKPWIRDVWEKNGLVSDEKNHVWRAEISIKCEGMDVLNMGTGQLFKISPRYLDHYENIVKLFHFYAAKYFDFRINTGQENKRNYKPLQLFDTGVAITCKPYQVSRSADTGRMEKICYNKLDKLSKQYSDLSSPVRSSLVVAMDFLQQLSGVKLSITRANQYKHYLDSLCGTAFIDSLDLAYMMAVDENFKQKREMDAEYTWYAMNAHYDAENEPFGL